MPEYKTQLKEHLKTSVFRGTSPQNKNDFIAAISSVLNEFIQEKFYKTEFVTFFLDETLDIENKSQLFTRFYYMVDLGNIKNRFFGFTDVNGSKMTDELFQVTDQVTCFALLSWCSKHINSNNFQSNYF